jgi:hypothetical protein
MAMIFTTIGPAAEGPIGLWHIRASLTNASRWPLAMILYILGFASYGATLAFYTAIFPRLARNSKRAREARELYERGAIGREVYERMESLEKNRISDSHIGGIHRGQSHSFRSCSLLMVRLGSPWGAMTVMHVRSRSQ